jgi:hypothetical protein
VLLNALELAVDERPEEQHEVQPDHSSILPERQPT